MKYLIKDLETNKYVKDSCTGLNMLFNTFISAEIYADAFIKAYEIESIVDNVKIVTSRSL